MSRAVCLPRRGRAGSGGRPAVAHAARESPHRRLPGARHGPAKACAAGERAQRDGGAARGDPRPRRSRGRINHRRVAGLGQPLQDKPGRQPHKGSEGKAAGLGTVWLFRHYSQVLGLYSKLGMRKLACLDSSPPHPCRDGGATSGAIARHATPARRALHAAARLRSAPLRHPPPSVGRPRPVRGHAACHFLRAHQR